MVCLISFLSYENFRFSHYFYTSTSHIDREKNRVCHVKSVERRNKNEERAEICNANWSHSQCHKCKLKTKLYAYYTVPYLKPPRCIALKCCWKLHRIQIHSIIYTYLIYNLNIKTIFSLYLYAITIGFVQFNKALMYLNTHYHQSDLWLENSQQ